MDFYSFLREFADSWALLGMFLVFLGAILWALRPGARAAYEDVSQIPFRNDDRPAAEAGAGDMADSRVKEWLK